MNHTDDVTGRVNLGNSTAPAMFERAARVIGAAVSTSRISCMHPPHHALQQGKPYVSNASQEHESKPTVRLEQGHRCMFAYPQRPCQQRAAICALAEQRIQIGP